MCTLAVWVNAMPGLPLVVAANRDEFLDRPATPPVVLADAPRIVGGRDLRAGGTWLALADTGVVAGVLNRRTVDAPDPSKRSRGALLVEALRAGTVDAAARLLAAADGRDYNGFNLLVADATGRAVVAQNHDRDVRLTWLDTGVHVLTNLDLDDPTCPKIARSHQLFVDAAARFAATRDVTALRAALRGILADHTTALDPRLPDALGALCVHTDVFGTRSSQLVACDDTGAFRHWYAAGPPCRFDYEPALVP